MKRLFIASILLGAAAAHAQNADDALRYSQTNIVGTSRFSSMGGAFGALGGDFGAVSLNPAGLGVYKRSELTFTPSFFYQSAKATYNGSTLTDERLQLNIANVGIVMSWEARSVAHELGWRNFSLGLGHNRTNNFHRNISIEGYNTDNSLLDVFAGQANNAIPEELDPFGARLAFDTYLIDTFPDDPTAYFTQLVKPGVTQRKIIDNEGSMGETVISFAGNYNDKFYLGGSVGFPRIRFEESSEYTEIADEDTLSYLNSFTYREALLTKGSGYNAKFGMIYRIKDWFRIGGAVHSPTFYSMSDRWQNSIKAEYKADSPLAGANEEVQSPEGSYNYSLTTPFRAIGSLGFIIKKQGILSVDYEHVDYSLAKLRARDYKFFNENNDIRDNYTAAGNIRLGAEWRIDPFSVRAGFSHLGNPFERSINDGSVNNYSVGFGIRQENYFLDFGYVVSKSSADYYIYDPGLANATKVDLTAGTLLFTLGLKY